MPKYTIAALLESSKDDFLKKLQKLSYCDLEEIRIVLNEAIGKLDSKSEIALKELNNLFISYYQEKEREHTLKYGKKLSPVLIDFLEIHFPRITNNIHKEMTVSGTTNMIRCTPLALAMSNDNEKVINALLDEFPFSDFYQNEPQSFSEILHVNDNMFVKIVDKIIQQPWEQANKLMVKLVHLNNEKRRKYIFEKFKKINFITAEPIVDLEQFIPYLIVNSFETLAYLVKQCDFDGLSASEAENITKIISSCLNSYAASTDYIKVSKIKHGRDFESLEAASNGLKSFISMFCQKIPENLQNMVSEAITRSSVLNKALETFDTEMVRFILENSPKIPIAQIRWILQNVDHNMYFGDQIKFLRIFTDYYHEEKIIDALLVDMGSDPTLFNLEDFRQLPELPFKWTRQQKEILFEIMSKNANEFGGEENLKAWITTFEKKSAVFDRMVHNLEVSISPPVQIDHKLFGHINNDHVLKGTHLEGLALEQTLKYFSRFVNDIRNRNWSLPDLSENEKKEVFSDLEGLQQQFLNCLKISEVMTHATSNPILGHKLSKDEVVDNVSNYIVEQLINNNGGLIPGGWMGLNNTPGHAMLYEFKKTDKGFQFIIHNSGAGLRFHETLDKPSGTFYATSKIYEIPMDSLADFQGPLKELIRTVVQPNILPAYNQIQDIYDETRVYTSIEHTTSRLGLIPVPTTPQNAQWTKGQSSGTCSWWALRSYLKTKLQGKILNYDDINYEVRRYSISDYYASYANEPQSDIYHNQMNFATQNLARDIRRRASKNVMTLESRIDGLNLLNKITRTEKSKEQLEIKIKKDKPRNTRPEILFGLQQVKTELAPLSSNTTPFVAQPNHTSFVFDHKAPLQSFAKLINICNDNVKNGHYHVVSKCIEDFYFSLPNDCSSKGWIGKKELNESLTQLMEMIQHTNSLYTLSLANQSTLIFAEQYMVHFLNLKLAHNIANLYFKQDIQQHAKDRLSLNNTEITHSAYFTNPDPVNNDILRQDKNEESRGLDISPATLTGNRSLDLVPATWGSKDSIIMEPAILSKQGYGIKNIQAEMVHLIISQDPLIKKKLLDLLAQEDYMKQEFSLDLKSDSEMHLIAGQSPPLDSLEGLLPPSLKPVEPSALEPVKLTPRISNEAESPSASLPPLTGFGDLMSGGLLSLDELNKPSLSKPKPEINLIAQWADKIPDSMQAALYYLKNREKLKDKQEYAQIETDLRFLLNTEKIRSNYYLYCNGGFDDLTGRNLGYLDEFYAESYKDLEHFSVEKSPSGKFAMIGKLEYLKEHERGRTRYDLKDSLPPIVSDLIERCIINSACRTSNEIQTNTVRDVVSEATALERSLLNTRLDSRTQVSSTLDLAKKEFLRLQDPDFQNFIFLNLFQGGLLQDQLKDSPDTAQDLLKLIRRGLDT